MTKEFCKGCSDYFIFGDIELCLNVGEENIHNIKICPEHDVSEEEIILKGD